MTKSFEKLNGVYYTPQILTDFASEHIRDFYLNEELSNIKILEPSVGDGEFASSFVECQKKIYDKIRIDIVDTDGDQLNKAVDRLLSSEVDNLKINYTNCDFLDFNSNGKYDVIIGNPPYVGKRDLSHDQIENCVNIQRELVDEKHEFKNIWTTFVFKCLSLLKKNGVFCQVLPIELLHVKYTGVLRKYLLSNFKRIEIFTFNEIVFDNTLQDVVLIFASNSKSIKTSGTSFYEVNKLVDLKEPNYTIKNSNLHKKSLDKWSNYILTDSELNFVEQIKAHFGFSKVINYCNKIEVGLVTAANSFFILSNDDIEEFGLEKYTRKIIQKSSYVKQDLYISDDSINRIELRGGATNLVAIPNLALDEINDNIVRNYVSIGESENLHHRFKMKRRVNWYHVPTKWMPSGFFMKRIDNYPKVLINRNNSLSTDSLYIMSTLPMYEIENVAGSFYNILTFIDCELKGRYYGGGVLELTPNEFKDIEVPYVQIEYKQLNILDDLIKKNNIDLIVDFGFNNALKGISLDEISKLKVIYSKLVNRRKKCT